MNADQQEFWENLTGMNVKIITLDISGRPVSKIVMDIFINCSHDANPADLTNHIRQVITDQNGEAVFRTNEKIQSMHGYIRGGTMAYKLFRAGEEIVLPVMVI